MIARLRWSLQVLGLLGVARGLRRLCSSLLPSHWPRIRHNRRAFEDFKRAHYEALRSAAPGATAGGRRKVLLLSSPGRTIETELWLIKALKFAGLDAIVVVGHERRHLRRYHRLAGASETWLTTEFGDDLHLAEEASALIEKLGSSAALIGHQHAGARVGLFAVSTAMRRLRTGCLDLANPDTRKALTWHLTAALTAAATAHRIVDRVQPAMAVVADSDYTPMGQMFDVCLAHHIDVLSYDIAHKSDALVLKRYTPQNRTEHLASLSDASWRMVREMPWNETRRSRLWDELHGAYEKRDWYSSAGTQFGTRRLGGDELRRELGLDPHKRTAVIFPHISWDAPFGWGAHLFKDYDDWLLETVRAACRNDRMNWVVKFHPANVGKAAIGKYREEPSESAALRKHFSSLPRHVVTMRADSGISTESVFAIMDYCLTVRGTIGLEAAIRGIPALTGGAGRYDRRGFTIDSDTPAEYLERIARIHDIAPLAPAQTELAQRYAYGLFVLRPLPLTSLSLRFRQDGSTSGDIAVRRESRIEARTRADWDNAPDLKALVHWLRDPGQLDFLMPVALDQGAGSQP